MVSSDVCRVKMTWTPIDSGADGEDGGLDLLFAEPSREPVGPERRRTRSPGLRVLLFGNIGRDDNVVTTALPAVLFPISIANDVS